MIANKTSITKSSAKSSETRSHSTHNRLFALAIGLGVFLVLLTTRSHVLTQLPTWDGAMGMTPAALTLVETDFNLLNLIRQPSYFDGGPNTHSLSLATLTTAGIVALIGSYESSLPILHLVSFALAGALAAGVYLLVVQAIFDRFLAVSAAGITILYPPVLVQASDVYLDLPMTTAIVWGLHLASSGRRKAAIAMACVAIWIKPTAVIALPAIAYLLASDPTSRLSRWSTIAAMAPPAALVLGVFTLTGSYAGGAQTNALTRLVTTIGDGVWYSTHSPALLVLVSAAIIALAATRKEARIASAGSARVRLILAMEIFLASTLLFFLLNPLVTGGFPILPRYTIVLAPTLSALIVASISMRGRRAAVSSCLALSIAMVALWSGSLAPSGPNYYALSERDLSYPRHIAVQQQAIDQFEKLSRLMPVYYDHFAHFRFEYPQMGWTSGSPAEGTPAYLAPGNALDIEEMPSQFALLVETHWLGGQKLIDVWQAATASEYHRTKAYEHRSGRYVNYVIVVTKIER